MLELHDLPQFRGEGSEDAESWLLTFLATTATLNDNGVMRIMSRQLPSFSPAREWYESLDMVAKGSWNSFETEFRARWFSNNNRNQISVASAEWDQFQNHQFCDIMSPEFGQEEGENRSVAMWLTEHRALATSTKRGDRDLTHATFLLLPDILRAHLRLTDPKGEYNFDETCNAIESVPTAVWRLESLRRKEAENQWPLRFDRMLGELHEKINNLEKMLNEKEPSSLQKEPKGNPSNESESIQWEACSSLTSEPTTPTAQFGNLPNVAGCGSLAPNPTELHTSSLASTNLGSGSVSDVSVAVPVEWRKPHATLTTAERTHLAWNAIENLFQFRDDTSILGLTGSIGCCWAIYDRLGGKNKIQTEERLLKHINPCRQGYDDTEPSSLWSGLASIQLFRSYGKIAGLEAARNVWTNVENGPYYGVFKANQDWINNYYSTIVGIAMPHGASILAGGVIRSFYHIYATKTVAYMVLSAHLAELTNQDVYRTTAEDTARYIKSQMFDPMTSLVEDCLIGLADCKKHVTRLSSHLTGLFIEGLCVLATVTKEESWMTLALECSIAAMKFADWHSPNGIMVIGAGGDPLNMDDINAFKGVLIRGLHEVYARNPYNNPLRDLIRSYVNVQYNALLDFSRRKNFYGMSWSGPYIGPFLHAQAAAADVLVAAVGVNN